MYFFSVRVFLVYIHSSSPTDSVNSANTAIELGRVKRKKKVCVLTFEHENVDISGRALGSLHAVASLQQVVHLCQVHTGIRRHAICGQLPQQHAKRCNKDNTYDFME
jgi:hypothetical protein